MAPRTASRRAARTRPHPHPVPISSRPARGAPKSCCPCPVHLHGAGILRAGRGLEQGRTARLAGDFGPSIVGVEAAGRRHSARRSPSRVLAARPGPARPGHLPAHPRGPPVRPRRRAVPPFRAAPPARAPEAAEAGSAGGRRGQVGHTAHMRTVQHYVCMERRRVLHTGRRRVGRCRAGPALDHGTGGSVAGSHPEAIPGERIHRTAARGRMAPTGQGNHNEEQTTP